MEVNMKKQTLIYNNLINKEGFNPFSKKQYFAIPVIPIKVALKYDVKPGYNHFERAILTLLLSKKKYTILEISEILCAFIQGIMRAGRRMYRGSD